MDNLEKNFNQTPKSDKMEFDFSLIGDEDYISDFVDKNNHISKEIALKIIESGYGIYVAQNLEKFSGLNHNEIAQIVVKYLEKFSGLDHNEIAQKLIEVDWGGVVVTYIDKFSGLNYQEIALKLIETGYGGNLVNYLEKFSDLDHKEIALKLIEAKRGECVFNELEKFSGLDKEVALKLIEDGRGQSVVKYLEKFSGLNYQEIALKLIEAGEGVHIIYNLGKFPDLDQEIALKLIEAGEGVHIIYNLDKFPGLDQEVALKLIEAGEGYQVADYLEKFSGLDHKEIALKLIEAGRGDMVAYNLGKFPDLDQEVALKLIEAGQGTVVINNLKKFPDLDQEVALKLIEAGQGYQVADYLEKFSGLDHKEIALKLFEAGQGDMVAYNLEKFTGLDHKDMALKLFEAGQGGSVAENLDKFQLSPLEFYQSVEEKYPEFIAEIKTKIPKLAEQLEKSASLLINILLIKDDFNKIEKNIANNPFLLEALEDNPRYGSKLILKYQKFDKTSKHNIKELFDNEAEILKQNPDIDKESVDFRQLMQEKLMSYASNEEIVAELENRGVNSEEWLNYDKQTYFSLGEEEDVKFSEQIKTPITRIKETLGKYQDAIVTTLSDYKTELVSALIARPEEEDLKQKIAELKQRIESEGDQKKAQGMQKGLVGLEAKKAALKPVSVWSKVQSDIFRLQSMIENIFKFHDACVATETKIEVIKDRKELVKEKDRLAKDKIKLRDNFQEFEEFFESYELKLQEIITPSLGQDRSDSLLQEIKEKIGEEMSHYDTDKNTLKKIFSEKDEEDNKLNGREMKISIASRSTHDLYLGNYCPCCICIESTHHGAESPIADYVTDLGIQNIVVYDEKAGSPVVACWTFIGENSADGKPIMVIDNIEANTEYTGNYPDQLREVIEKYINDYAKAINIDVIIQGAHNNDLVVFSTGSVNRKLGDKYNRSDGYFLEAENDDYEQQDDEWDDEQDDNDN